MTLIVELDVSPTGVADETEAARLKSPNEYTIVVECDSVVLLVVIVIV